MYWRWTALVGIAAVLAPLTAIATGAQGSPLVDTDFRDWTGIVKKTVLGDNSVLSEYIAQTRSSETQGAMLEVAFIPRFQCSPLLRLVVPEQSGQIPPENALIQLSIDGVIFDFPSLVDSDSGMREYAFLATHAGQQELREVLDGSSRLRVQWTTTSDDPVALADPDDEVEPIKFSLLGSLLSVEAVEALCQAHTPIAFELSESD